MHRGGIRHGGGGGGRGRGRHPSGLTGKEIGLWYAARGKEKKRNRELTERDVVTMSSQKEEKINQLLERLQDVPYQSSSHSHDRHHHGNRDHYGTRHHHGNRQYHGNKHHHGNRYDNRYSLPRDTDAYGFKGQYGNRESHDDRSASFSDTPMHEGSNERLQDDPYQSSSHSHDRPMERHHHGNRGHYGNRYDKRYSLPRNTDAYGIKGQYGNRESHDDRSASCSGKDHYMKDEDHETAMHQGSNETQSSSHEDVIMEEKMIHNEQSTDKQSASGWKENKDMNDGGDLSDNEDDDKDISIKNDQPVEDDALFMFDELGSTTTKPALSFRASPFGNDALQRDAVVDDNLKLEFTEKSVSNRKYIEMQAFRSKLPSYNMREELLDLMRKNQVVVISGETGCGKTTQVAQFILDDAIKNGQGSLCRIACTQPRRISAISVAERVAKERGEPCGGYSVGYQIRLESKLPRSKGSIIYCTTGVLLRWLISDGLLHNISCVIIDEIHERDLMSDFLLIIVKDVLPRRPDLKLVLMSATLNAEMFSSYFNGCPMAHIPGYTFPVKEYYVEDVIEMTRYQNPNSSKRQDNFRGPRWKRQAGVKSWAKKRRAEKMGFGEEQEIDDEEVQWREYLNTIKTRYSQSTLDCLENMDFDSINVDLVVKLIIYICTNLENGAILVFLPGWDDISKVHDSLKNVRVFSSDKYLIIPLHSMMPTASQHQVFDRPPSGVRKIVLATNIAETSITIDDVVYVIDCGKVKEKSYDVSRKISCLMPVWISKASSRQRKGRAGRVQPGQCFHLFTEYQAQKMIDYQLPEMLRTPLEELCLQIKILKLGMIGEFLSKALQPPSPEAVQNALDTLKQLNALDHNECLTPLGYHLASLPVDPRIGKIILFGAIFSCLDPVLTIASTLGFKEPFVFPLDKKKQTDRVRMKFAGDTRSDHLAVLNAYQGWERAKRHNNEGSYCWENFLSKQTLKMLSDMKLQFARLLCDIGFLDNTNPKNSTANQNSDNLKLVKGVLCAGLYPNVVHIEHHARLKFPPKMFTREDGKVALHPKSVNVENVVYENNWLIYHQKMKSSKVFIHDATMISPYPLLFFGGEISVLVEEGHEIIAVDEFIRFRSPRKIANIVKELRGQLDRLLERKISQPDLRLTVASSTTEDSGSLLLHAIIDLITTEESKNWKRRRAMEEREEMGSRPSFS